MAETGQMHDRLTTLLPTVIALASFGLAGFNWYNQRNRAWEENRPLATLELQSQTAQVAPGRRLIQVRLKTRSLGVLTSVMRNVQIDVSTSDGLEVAWEECSLLDGDDFELPLGLSDFEMRALSDRAMSYDFERGSWHVVDPGREIEIPFLIPFKGEAGVINIGAIVFLQVLPLGSYANEITEPITVNSQVMRAVPESGVGDVSDELIYPYSVGHQIIVTTPPAPQPAPHEAL